MIARRTFLLALPAGLAGCSGPLGGGSPPQLYTLTPLKSFPPNLPRSSAQLLIEAPSAPGGLDTERIALMKSTNSLDYFAGAAWTDRAPKLVQDLLVESFENTGKIAAIDRESLALRADFVLEADLRDFTAIYSGSGMPVARVRMGLKLVRLPEKQIVGSHTAAADAPTQENSVPTVVQAFDTALHQVIGDAVAWTLTSMGPR
ncbi:MAG TPA: ABC-type transport auxiliary lipoprotein family protein [Stellaceae bacterium]|nr:ABC-type transport auxiliary lipoprotein family protein [Stellaceae bacterium]